MRSPFPSLLAVAAATRRSGSRWWRDRFCVCTARSFRLKLSPRLALISLRSPVPYAGLRLALASRAARRLSTKECWTADPTYPRDTVHYEPTGPDPPAQPQRPGVRRRSGWAG